MESRLPAKIPQFLNLYNPFPRLLLPVLEMPAREADVS